MSLDAGTFTVTVDATGAPTYAGAGLARTFGESLIAGLISSGVAPAVPTVGMPLPNAPAGAESYHATQADRDSAIAARKGLFKLAEVYANAHGVTVAYFVANAEIDVTTVTAHVSQSVGRMTNPLVAGADIDPPASPVELPLLGIGTLT